MRLIPTLSRRSAGLAVPRLRHAAPRSKLERKRARKTTVRRRLMASRMEGFTAAFGPCASGSQRTRQPDLAPKGPRAAQNAAILQKGWRAVYSGVGISL